MGSKRGKGTEKRKSRFCGCKTYGLGTPGIERCSKAGSAPHKSAVLPTVFGIII